jgi:hypothetical protein
LSFLLLLLLLLLLLFLLFLLLFLFLLTPNPPRQPTKHRARPPLEEQVLRLDVTVQHAMVVPVATETTTTAHGTPTTR